MKLLCFIIFVLAGELNACDVSSWPDVKRGKVCGTCKALIKNMDNKYTTCDNYCKSFGSTCTGAWEDAANSCRVKSTESCQHNFAAYTSDAICACGEQTGQCDMSSWPDVKGGNICGACKALIKNMDNKYSTCDKFCKSFGSTCTGAWEDAANSCRVKSTENCQHNFGAYTSDAICACGEQTGQCDMSSWPDVKSGKVCGACKALIKNMDNKHSTCDNYCKSFGSTCTGAWEDAANSCRVKRTENCQHNFGAYTSDAICSCGEQSSGGNQPAGYCNIGSAQPKGSIPNSVRESSGLAFSTRNPGTLYTHNDSGGNATIYAMDQSGKLRAEITLQDVSNTDWEDIAVTGNKIYIGDVGNNGRNRKNLRIIRLDDPIIGDINIPRSQVTELRVRYPKDENYDSEGIVVDPSTKDLYLFTKQSKSRVYRYPNVATAQGGPEFELEFVAELPIKVVTAADLSPDGNSLVLTNYDYGYSYTKPAGESWKSYLQSNAGSYCRLDIKKRGGMEAVAVSEDGIWTSNECNKCDINFFPRN